MKEAARVAAQVEYDTGHTIAELSLQSGHSFVHAGFCLFTKCRDTDVADIVFNNPVAHGLNCDDRARERDVKSLIVASCDGNGDVGICRSAHHFDGFVKWCTDNGLTIDMSDDVVGLDARTRRGCVINWRHDTNAAGFILNHFDPKAAKFAAC